VVDNTLGVKVGDQVVVAVEESALVQGSLLMYLLPLLFMFALGIIGEYLFASELLTVLASLLGLSLGMLLVRYVLLQSHLKSSIQPHLVRRVH
jgi:sigma-E factor negative regulatory protein RseC